MCRCREPRWVFARFHLNGSKTLAAAMPVHTPGSGSDGVTAFTISADRCNGLVGSPWLCRRAVPASSGRSNRQAWIVVFTVRQQGPGDARILVGERDGCDIGMPPFPQLTKPAASGILLAPGSPERGARAMDQQGAQVAIATFTDAKQAITAATGPRCLGTSPARRRTGDHS